MPQCLSPCRLSRAAGAVDSSAAVVSSYPEPMFLTPPATRCASAGRPLWERSPRLLSLQVWPRGEWLSSLTLWEKRKGRREKRGSLNGLIALHRPVLLVTGQIILSATHCRQSMSFHELLKYIIHSAVS